MVGTPTRAPRNARRALARVRGDAEGLYRVSWAVVGLDGHTVGGEYRFRVRR